MSGGGGMLAIVIAAGAFLLFQIGRLVQWISDAKDVMKGERRRR